MPEENGTVPVSIALASSDTFSLYQANLKIWFSHLEGQFTLEGIIVQITNFLHGASALQPEELAIDGKIILKLVAKKPTLHSKSNSTFNSLTRKISTFMTSFPELRLQALMSFAGDEEQDGELELPSLSTPGGRIKVINWLYLSDRASKSKHLESDVSVVPLTEASKKCPPAPLQFFSANRISISTYGQRLLTLDLDL
ncbi:hypothetical protein NPIL_410961 [Nephila pilipes]|uniref:Uncharacterized protein n=1 Tax=Nephila pilipes TaxID=299642 RepID=A0A8X6JZR9_NEPPI|nr:hypothetical protein NPIL_410961 [Nephila pilipes]